MRYDPGPWVWHVIPAEDKKLDDVKKDIALELMKTDAAKVLARQKAEAALAAAQGGKNLLEQFPPEAKEEKGPSDERARVGGLDAGGETAEGVNATATKKHLLDVARRLDVTGRSRMTKAELVDAIMKANRRFSAKSR